MNNVNLQDCCARFHKLIAGTIKSSEVPMTGLMSTEAQLYSRRHIAQWIEDMSCFLRHVDSNDRVLDFGTGSGFSAISFAYAGCQVEAIDIDNNMRDNPIYARGAEEQLVFWRILEAGYGNLHFQHYKNVIPFGANQFDAVMAYGVLEHVPDQLHESVMGEISRVLKPGGCLFISFLPRRWSVIEHLAKAINKPHHDRLWGDWELKRFLSGHGYEIKSFERIIFAPQHPPEFSNRHEVLFNALDRIARLTPLGLFSHHMRVVARKTG